MRAARARLLSVTLLALLLVLPLALPGASAAGQASALSSPTSLPLNDAAFRSDGAVALAVGGAPGQGVVLRIADGQASVARSDGHRYLAVAWSPAAGEALVVGDGTVLRTTDGTAFAALALPQGIASFDGRAVAWKPDGSQALLAGSALLRYWSANQSLELLRASADEAFGAAAWRPDGAHALVEQAVRADGAWSTGRLLRFDGASLQHVATYGTGQGLVEGVAWAGSGAWALVYGFDGVTRDGPVMRWDGADLAPAFTKDVDRFTGFAWRPGGANALMTGSSGQRLAESDGASFEVLLDDGADLTSVAWHPSGAHALLTGPGGLLLKWLPEGQPVVRVTAPLPGAALAGPFDVLARAEPRAGQPIQGVEVRVDQGAWQPMAPVESGLWQLRLEPSLPDGAHVLEVRARDAGVASEPARVQVRFLSQAPAAPRFLDPPAGDADGLLALDWTDTAADRYELQGARDASFAAPRLLATGPESAASVRLAEAGAHHLRVRGVVGGAASAWSAPAVVQVTLTESPFLPDSPREGGAASSSGGNAAGGSPEPGLRGAPGAELALALTAVAAAALARRARRR